ncbi:hypothetical protein [Streptomyces sp. NPDC002082]|uniref:hypothetical protein n=1 Tax=Streptomyces sp. NPDC002082 TaxID=3154772 RepID=UPI0033264309
MACRCVRPAATCTCPTTSTASTALPTDYKRIVETFGEGAFDAYLSLHQEPWADLREDGLIVWAGTEHEDL